MAGALRQNGDFYEYRAWLFAQGFFPWKIQIIFHTFIPGLLVNNLKELADGKCPGKIRRDDAGCYG